MLVAVTENLAFDPQSGKPVLVRTADDYDGVELDPLADPHDGSYYSVSLPAHWYYSGLSQRALSDRRDFGSTVGDGKFLIHKRFGDMLHTLTVKWEGEDGTGNPVDELQSG